MTNRPLGRSPGPDELHDPGGPAAAQTGGARRKDRRLGTRVLGAGIGLLVLAASGGYAVAFCGFYVAKADTELFNNASKVVLARYDGRTVISMANDYEGDLTEFAIVVPVPQILERKQIHVADNALIDHLDAYTAPRLVEFHDPDPCMRVLEREMATFAEAVPAMSVDRLQVASALGVAIEAEYTVGEYDILILSAQESGGLLTWLTGSGYRLPAGAESVLGDYLDAGMFFFVAKVNLAEQAKLGGSYLRPLQIAFESPDFMLPIRLGMLNADGAQELFVMTLTRKGRVEAANYRNARIPSDLDVPIYVKDQFGDFYTAMFDQAVAGEDMRAVFLEYAWDMAWCDPCAAEPLSVAELRELGVFWLAGGAGMAQDVFVTRMHLRYDADHFPTDLEFRETADRQNFQGRYVLRHPWTGEIGCNAAKAYLESLPARFEGEAETLASLTGWPVDDIRADMVRNGQSFTPIAVVRPWYERIWPGDD